MALGVVGRAFRQTMMCRPWAFFVVAQMIKFADVFYPGSKLSTFFESCGVADLITTCYGGRNRRVSEAFVKTKKVNLSSGSLLLVATKDGFRCSVSFPTHFRSRDFELMRLPFIR